MKSRQSTTKAGSTQPVATPVPAQAITAELVKLGITHVITVPDTIQRTLLVALEESDALEVLTVSTEDEAMGINAGLYVTGHRPMLLIQNTGFFASTNTLKSIALDAQVPTFIFVGQFGRDVTKSLTDGQPRRVGLLEPTLDVWGVPHYRLERPEDIGNVALAYHQSYEQRGPVVVIVGAPTG